MISEVWLAGGKTLQYTNDTWSDGGAKTSGPWQSKIQSRAGFTHTDTGFALHQTPGLLSSLGNTRRGGNDSNFCPYRWGQDGPRGRAPEPDSAYAPGPSGRNLSEVDGQLRPLPRPGRPSPCKLRPHSLRAQPLPRCPAAPLPRGCPCPRCPARDGADTLTVCGTPPPTGCPPPTGQARTPLLKPRPAARMPLPAAGRRR